MASGRRPRRYREMVDRLAAGEQLDYQALAPAERGAVDRILEEGREEREATAAAAASVGDELREQVDSLTARLAELEATVASSG